MYFKLHRALVLICMLSTVKATFSFQWMVHLSQLNPEIFDDHKTDTSYQEALHLPPHLSVTVSDACFPLCYRTLRI